MAECIELAEKMPEDSTEMHTIMEDEIPEPFTWAGMPLPGFEYIESAWEPTKEGN